MKTSFAASVIAIALVASVSVALYLPDAAYAASDELALSVDSDIVSANNDFGLDIFSRLVGDEDSGKNVFISPLSISTCLAMVYIGSDGETRAAMADTLNFDSFSLEKLKDEYSKLIGSLEGADNSVALSIANSAWIRQEYEEAIKQSYKDAIDTNFDASIFARDFSNPQTVGEINGWVSQETNGMIDKMIDSIPTELVMYLINAIYFKGDWVNQFDASDTSKADFHLSDGGTMEADMMYVHDKFNYSYYEEDGVQVGRLPYGRDKIAMYVFLPDEGMDVDSFVAGLDDEKLEAYIEGLPDAHNLDLYLPKFEVEYGKKRLNDVLADMGMQIAFDPSEAGFSEMATVPLFISFVDHKAVIKVNEEGTEAAAVTVVGMELTSTPQYEEFRVDRPFFFVIRDDRSGSILFMGKVMDPTAN